jgi:hypothetical protein
MAQTTIESNNLCRPPPPLNFKSAPHPVDAINVKAERYDNAIKFAAVRNTNPQPERMR